MLTVYIWIYTLVLAIIWGFFIVAKIHANKFKSFSNHIKIVTKVLFIFLLTLSILWYILIIFNSSNTKVEVKNYNSDNVWDVSY